MRQLMLLCSFMRNSQLLIGHLFVSSICCLFTFSLGKCRPPSPRRTKSYWPRDWWVELIQTKTSFNHARKLKQHIRLSWVHLNQPMPLADAFLVFCALTKLLGKPMRGYSSSKNSLILTSWDRNIHGDFRQANGFGCRVWTLNNDIAKILSGRCTVYSSTVRGSQWATILSTERVWRLVDWSSCRWVVVCQPDHKVAQAICYKIVKTDQLKTHLAQI